MRPHEKLDVWNQSVDLAVAIYKAHRLDYLSRESFLQLGTALDDVGKMMNGLSRHLRNKTR